MKTLKSRAMGVLTLGSDAKTKKGQKEGYATGILYLAPVKQAGFGNVCPFASKGCSDACLYTAGRGKMSSVMKARMAKTRRFFKEKDQFVSDIIDSVRKIKNYVAKHDFIPCIRLNGTSDIPWEKLGIMQKYPTVQFYDYTKNPNRMEKYLDGKMPSNYHLTFSLNEANFEKSIELLEKGANVAMVFNTPKNNELPLTYYGYKVIDGDKSDLRFLDESNVIVGLRAKGDAKKDTSGFVIHV